MSQGLGDVCASEHLPRLDAFKAPVGRFVPVSLGLSSHVRQMRSFPGHSTLIGDMEYLGR